MNNQVSVDKKQRIINGFKVNESPLPIYEMLGDILETMPIDSDTIETKDFIIFLKDNGFNILSIIIVLKDIFSLSLSEATELYHNNTTSL